MKAFDGLVEQNIYIFVQIKFNCFHLIALIQYSISHNFWNLFQQLLTMHHMTYSLMVHIVQRMNMACYRQIPYLKEKYLRDMHATVFNFI